MSELTRDDVLRIEAVRFATLGNPFATIERMEEIFRFLVGDGGYGPESLGTDLKGLCGLSLSGEGDAGEPKKEKARRGPKPQKQEWNDDIDAEIIRMHDDGDQTYQMIAKAVGRHHFAVKFRLQELLKRRGAIETSELLQENKQENGTESVIEPQPVSVSHKKQSEPAPISSGAKNLVAGLQSVSTPKRKPTNGEVLEKCWGKRLKTLGMDYSLDGAVIGRPRLARITNEERVKQGLQPHSFGADWNLA